LTPLAGQTGYTLVLTNVQTSEGGDYWVMVSGGGEGVSSDGAVLKVEPAVLPPEVVVAPQVTNGTFSVGFQGTPGLTYTIQSKDSLEGAWQNRTTVIVPPGGVIPFVDDVSGQRQRFYRAIYPPR
jgi:hypothetical protein